MKTKTVGVIGGLGPLATIYFMNLVMKYTKVDTEQDYIDMIVINQASIPDRTKFILGLSKENPEKDILKNAKILQKLNCDFLVMPCNTAHFIYEKIENKIKIPLINIVKETVDSVFKQNNNIKKIGLMATEGTIKANIYKKEIQNRNVCVFIPNQKIQDKITSFIYDYVKKNRKVPDKNFFDVINYFYKNNCDAIIIGCTELSVIIEDKNVNDPRIIDSLKVLALETIKKAGKKKL